MKTLTPNKRPTPNAKVAKAPAKMPAKITKRREAQCCAKTSRTAVGCHD